MNILLIFPFLILISCVNGYNCTDLTPLSESDSYCTSQNYAEAVADWSSKSCDSTCTHSECCTGSGQSDSSDNSGLGGIGEIEIVIVCAVVIPLFLFGIFMYSSKMNRGLGQDPDMVKRDPSTRGHVEAASYKRDASRPSHQKRVAGLQQRDSYE